MFCLSLSGKQIEADKELDWLKSFGSRRRVTHRYLKKTGHISVLLSSALHFIFETKTAQKLFRFYLYQLGWLYCGLCISVFIVSSSS